MNQMLPQPTLTVDSITLQVIRGAFGTIAEEMERVLYQMSFSSDHPRKPGPRRGAL